MARSHQAKYRRWANGVAIFVGLYVLAWAIWTPLGGSGVNEAGWWGTHAAAGGLAVLAPFAALRISVLARLMLIASVAILAIGFFSVEWLAMESLLSLLLPGVLLLLAAPFMGVMPTESEEHRLR